METKKVAKETLCDCGHIARADGCTPGYGVNDKGKKICFECCAIVDKDLMAKTGRATLYLSTIKDGNLSFNEVSNWPGTLKIKCYYSKTSKHNIAGHREDVWFIFNNHVWHGTQYGSNSQLCHCKQTKEVRQ